MEKLKNYYDRVLALCIAVVTVAISSSLVMKSLAIAEKFPPVPVNVNPAEFETMDGAEGMAAHLDVEHRWQAAGSDRAGDIYRAFSSVPVFWHDGGLVHVDDAPIRGEVPNAWLIENGLPLRRDDVLAMDPDRDGFTNGEEYALGQTDPNDRASHPDLLHKLSLAGVVTEDCRLVFASQVGGKANVRKVGGARSGKTWFGVGDLLPSKRHRLVAVGTGEIAIAEIESGEESVLKRTVPINLPIYRAEFAFEIDPSEFAQKYFQRGESFAVPGSGSTCEVKSVGPESVTLGVQRAGGSTETITLQRASE